jgi:predicted phage terminase large subunit-like protein
MITRQQAAFELLARRQARTRLIDFTKYTFPGYKADPVHHLLASTLDQVVEGAIRRLLINLPPQFGKSELASVRLPAYWLGKRPDDPVAIASYAADLAELKSGEARGIIESDDYQSVFGERRTKDLPPVKTRRDSRAINQWGLAYPYRGRVRAIGIGGGLSGYPAKLAIIDDPHKDWKEAQSLTYRDAVWEWYKSVLRARMGSGGAIIVIQTRWHEDDLTGRLLKNFPGMWTLLRLPAKAETQEERDRNNEFLGQPLGLPDPLGRKPGETLSPSRYSQADVDEIEVEVGSVVWASLYQGVPRAAEGNRIKREWLSRIQRARPMDVVGRVRYWDKAGTSGSGAWTAGVLIVKGRDGKTYIEDVVRGQWSALERENVMKQTATLDAQAYGGASAVHIYIEQEPGSGGKESAEATTRNLAGFVVFKDQPSGDKDTRLEPFAAQAEAGNVILIEGAWNRDYIEELVAIPNGQYRDQADATAGAFNKLNEAQPGQVRTAKFKWD